MKHSELFALNEWLSDYPAHMSYDEVIDLLHDGDERIVVWRWFEHIPTSSLIENIDNTHSHFEHTVNRMKTEGVFA